MNTTQFGHLLVLEVFRLNLPLKSAVRSIIDHNPNTFFNR